MTDPIDAAIAAQAQSKPIQMRTVQFQLMPSGKPVRIDLPMRIEDGEAFALVEAMVQIIRTIQAEQPKPAIARLVLPT